MLHNMLALLRIALLLEMRRKSILASLHITPYNLSHALLG